MREGARAQPVTSAVLKVYPWANYDEPTHSLTALMRLTTDILSSLGNDKAKSKGVALRKDVWHFKYFGSWWANGCSDLYLDNCGSCMG